jgi:hypothetical protein
MVLVWKLLLKISIKLFRDLVPLKNLKKALLKWGLKGKLKKDLNICRK